MDRSGTSIVETLGTPGLVRVLADLLDRAKLVRLATACGLKYPGMRTQSQRRDRLLVDLAERARADAKARKVIALTLAKETASTRRQWNGLSIEDRRRRLSDDGGRAEDGALGLLLFLVAAEGPAELRQDSETGDTWRELLELAGRTNEDSTDTRDEGPARLPAGKTDKKVVNLTKKLSHLEAQLAKNREEFKTLKRDLIHRKGELAESRMLVERLRRDVADAKATSTPPLTPSRDRDAPGDPAVPELATAVRKLAAEQRRLGQQFSKLATTLAPRPTFEPAALEAAIASLAELQREFVASRRERKKQLAEHSKTLDEIKSEIRASAPLPDLVKVAKRERATSSVPRVGVFVDVQNVYYSARQLRGKLDFDALIEAAVIDRRLIQATAYVVESPEIDQSQFIARLQRRAIDVRRKALQVRADGSMKGDWDMELALDILDAAPRLDVVVLVSGDGDFTSLVKRVKAMGPRVEVFAFPQNTAKSLLEAADRFQPLDERFVIRAAAEASRGRSRRSKPVTAKLSTSGPVGPSGAAKQAETGSADPDVEKVKSSKDHSAAN